jgi:hypothetical protein
VGKGIGDGEVDGISSSVGDGVGTATLDVASGIALGDGESDVAVAMLAAVDDGDSGESGDAAGTDEHDVATVVASRATASSRDEDVPVRARMFTHSGWLEVAECTSAFQTRLMTAVLAPASLVTEETRAAKRTIIDALSLSQFTLGLG